MPQPVLTAAGVVSDLQWAINSPSLLDADDSIWQPAPIESSDVDGDELVEFLTQRTTTRVGRYFESLVEFYLRKIRPCEIIVCQQQVVVGGRTLGEIDFVFRDESGVVTHLETAVKFFLHLPENVHRGSQFVGPNPNDTFEIKSTRIFEHQLPISTRVRQDVDRRLGMMKGRIYYHVSESDAVETPARLAKDHSQGTWFRASEWNRDSFDDVSTLCLMKKPHWLFTNSADDHVEIDDFGRIIRDHFSRSNRPIHGWYMGSGSVQFFFAVSDRWPRA